MRWFDASDRCKDSNTEWHQELTVSFTKHKLYCLIIIALGSNAFFSTQNMCINLHENSAFGHKCLFINLTLVEVQWFMYHSYLSLCFETFDTVGTALPWLTEACVKESRSWNVQQQTSVQMFVVEHSHSRTQMKILRKPLEHETQNLSSLKKELCLHSRFGRRAHHCCETRGHIMCCSDVSSVVVWILCWSGWVFSDIFLCIAITIFGVFWTNL